MYVNTNLNFLCRCKHFLQAFKCLSYKIRWSLPYKIFRKVFYICRKNINWIYITPNTFMVEFSFPLLVLVIVSRNARNCSHITQDSTACSSDISWQASVETDMLGTRSKKDFNKLNRNKRKEDWKRHYSGYDSRLLCRKESVSQDFRSIYNMTWSFLLQKQ